ncbi:MAG: DNA polymerase III subunit delta' [Rhodoferax sp.]|nr:DNA polymerase III subunit delta' [Rhodoferax sp.]
MSDTAAAPVAAPLAPWLARQLTSLLAQRGHAWLLQGPSGLGQYELALAMASSWLCDKPTAQGACGQCGSCHAIAVRTHADLCVLMPETTMVELAWPLSEKAQSDIDDKKRKASREIRVDAMRDAVEFAQRTSARGRGKVVLVYPAEDMNAITANALLKTLEEPAGDVRFVLASASVHQLLPTIRSRCIGHPLAWPRADEAEHWLQSQGLNAVLAAKLLVATGGRPAQALLWAQTGWDAAAWAAFPKAMQRGEVAAVKDWAPALLLDALHKLCHDLMALTQGAAPRFFAPPDLAIGRPPLGGLGTWNQALSKALRTVDHPFNAGLMSESLVAQAQSVLNSKL